MKGIPEVLADISRILNDLHFRHALLGGLAVALRVEPRFTRDVDLAVAVTNDVEAEALVHELASRGYTAAMTVEQEEAHRLATVRLRPSISREMHFNSSPRADFTEGETYPLLWNSCFTSSKPNV